jgi:hypothetical protein
MVALKMSSSHLDLIGEMRFRTKSLGTGSSTTRSPSRRACSSWLH